MGSSSDIILLLTSDSREWGKYITNKLSGFHQVSLTTLDLVLSDPRHESSVELKSAFQQSGVVLLLATYGLLDYMQKTAAWFAPILRELSSTGSLVVLLLMDRKQLDDVTEKYGYITSEWKCKDMRGSSTEVQQRIAEVLDIVEQCQQARRGKTSSFSSSRGWSRSPVEFFPSTVYERNTRVAIVFKEEIGGEVTLKLEQTDTPLTTVRETATVFTFTAPEKPPGRYNVRIFVDNKRQRGRPELTLRGTEMASLTSPHYLKQTLRLSSMQELDLRLKNLFHDSLPADQGLQILFRHLPQLDPADQQKNADTQYPTLLHYAAAFNLFEFCTALLDCPGSSRAFCIRNCDGLDPAELAAENGFYDLEDYILDFMEMQAAAGNEDDVYMEMGPPCNGNESDLQEDLYANSVQPYPRSSEDGSRSSTRQSQRVPVLPPRPEPLALRSSSPVYCTAESDLQVEQSSAPRIDPHPVAPPRSQRSRSARVWGPASGQMVEDKEQKRQARTLPRGARLDPYVFMGIDSSESTTRPELPAGAMGSRSQSELIAVQEQVKAQEISQREAQMLFLDWQQRYGRNTAASFKDRQKGLKKMRSELQRRSNTAMGSENVLTRFLFGGRQKKTHSVKLHISDPVLSPAAKKAAKVYTRMGSDSQLSIRAVDRDSASSMTSSSGSSRDSGYSQQLRHSTVSSRGTPGADIEEPELSPTARKAPKAYTRMGSDSQLFFKAADSDRASSVVGSPDPSRDSVCSQQLHHSTLSSKENSEAEIEEDDVFNCEVNVCKRGDHTGASSKNRLSLGDLYLKQALGERDGRTPPPLPSLNLPPIPTPNDTPDLSSSSNTNSLEGTHL